IWSLGCSTGEEAYSLAMLAIEEREAAASRREVKVFATDIDQQALNTANNGVYRPEVANELGEERAERFFRHTGDGLEVVRPLREMIVFARHDSLSDPPFSRVNLLVCRNLLIYLDAPRQAQLLAQIHFSLEPDGALLLGASETLGRMASAFEPVDGLRRLYRKRVVDLPDEIRRLPLRDGFAARYRAPPPADTRRSAMGAMKAHVLSCIAAEAAPPSLVVTQDGRLLFSFGDLSAYAALPSGELTTDAASFLHEPLRPLLMLGLRKASTEGEAGGGVYSNSILLGEAESRRRVRVDVRRLRALADESPNFLVNFVDEERPAPERGAGEEEGSELQSEYVASLESELRVVKETLQETIEELETSNEELQSSNEELIASNEELQSTNEELHSVNEELQTVNAEFQQKIIELTDISNDFDNILRSSEVGLIFLDDHLQIRNFTPTMASLMPLVEHDIGRPITAFSMPFDVPDLGAICRDVMERRQLYSREVQGPDDRVFVFNVFPFLTGADRPSGVVIKATEITALRDADKALQRSEGQFMALLDLTPVPMIFASKSLQIVRANAKLCELLGYRIDELLDRPLSSLFRRVSARSIDELKGLAQDEAEPFEAVARDGRRFPVELSVGEVGADADALAPIALRDVNAAQRAEQALKAAMAKLKRSNKELERFGAVVAHDLKEPLRAVIGYAKLLASDAEQSLDAQNREFLQRIVNGATRMQALIDDLLALASIDNDDTPVALANIGDLVAEARERLATVIDQSGAAVTVKDMPTLQVNPRALVQLFQNLIANAIKYRSEMPPNIVVSARRRRGAWEISVADNGVGIASEHQQRVFDIFTRLHARTGEGTGVGLAIAKKIVERHSGEIWVDSTPGEGSTFIFTLPNALDADAAAGEGAGS
ncbi:MAG: CheR family methyltransferase, partial [Pseudomonadota bacterium]